MDKTDRLLDAMNNPEKYSSEEIEEMLKDTETREILNLIYKTKSSLQPIQSPDIEEEWKNFRNKNFHKRQSPVLKFPAFFSRKIAASVSITIISITAVAAIVSISVSSLNNSENQPSEKEVATTNEVIIKQAYNITPPSESPTHSFETVIFDNELLDLIMNQIGVFYGYEIEFKNDNVKSLRLYYRWNQASTIQEIVESLNNFEQIKLKIESQTIKIY